MMPGNEMLSAATLLVGIAMIAIAMLKGWQGWLQLKTAELERIAGHAETARPSANLDRMPPEGAARIEIADLKERIRKLEAIASGVDL
ncbi:hypothetical protein [Paraurantiacibacter namhicola]|uniref:Uncharacterized protein n=1 Tax=Paraurantiacibacter namhicola TaxID=645517 RepID=A0A1C7DAH1_9SPHN|nr:hypothetical protein [Paraurantiacibacter namhicola]ANU08490.1 hypothetical protein A6F65_02205 [Paraurantiacibacter namhicola]